MDVVVETGTGTEGHPGTQDSGIARYLRDVGRNRLLSRLEEKALLERARSGDRKALNGLIAGNLKWVVAVSAEYAGRGLPLPDLIAEGNLGLIRAAVSFDPDHSFRFTAYAIWWIRQALEKALEEQARAPARDPAPSPSREVPRGPPQDPRLSQEVRMALERVREPGKTVIKLFFGLDARRPLRVEEISELLGLEAGRIRLLKEMALRRLQGSLGATRPLREPRAREGPPPGRPEPLSGPAP